MRHSGTPAIQGAKEARKLLPAILAAGAAGRTTLITRHGRAIAAVVPADALKRAKPLSPLTLAGSGRGLWGKHSRRTIAALRHAWTR